MRALVNDVGCAHVCTFVHVVVILCGSLFPCMSRRMCFKHYIYAYVYTCLCLFLYVHGCDLFFSTLPCSCLACVLVVVFVSCCHDVSVSRPLRPTQDTFKFVSVWACVCESMSDFVSQFVLYI